MWGPSTSPGTVGANKEGALGNRVGLTGRAGRAKGGLSASGRASTIILTRRTDTITLARIS